MEELCDYIIQYAPDIFVRSQRKGQWGSYSLIDLPPQEAIRQALYFIKQRRVPIRVKKEEEREGEEKD